MLKHITAILLFPFLLFVAYILKIYYINIYII